MSALVGLFDNAAELSRLEDSQRYQVYEMALKYAEIAPEDVLTIYVSDNRIAILPRGQWELIHNINDIVQETDGNFEFTFFGEAVIADHFVSDQEITLIHAPAGLIDPGAKLSNNAVFGGYSSGKEELTGE